MENSEYINRIKVYKDSIMKKQPKKEKYDTSFIDELNEETFKSKLDISKRFHKDMIVKNTNNEDVILLKITEIEDIIKEVEDKSYIKGFEEGKKQYKRICETAKEIQESKYKKVLREIIKFAKRINLTKEDIISILKNNNIKL